MIAGSSNVEESDHLQFTRERMNVLLEQYQTPQFYGNPYVTPFDSDPNERWSTSFDSLIQFQDSSEQEQDPEQGQRSSGRD